jgi:predicted RecA/RadA family phage recombinase
MVNEVKGGDFFTVTLGGTYAAGAAILMGDLVGVCETGGVSGDVVNVHVCGTFELPKKSTDTPAQGAKLYWDATNSELTTTSSTHKLAGYAYDAAISGATIVRCKLLL